MNLSNQTYINLSINLVYQ